MTTTLITGASYGIGKELAIQFAAGGDDVVLVARSEDKGYRDNEDVVIPGWKNRLMVTSTGFLPRFATRKLVGKLQGV